MLLKLIARCPWLTALVLKLRLQRWPRFLYWARLKILFDAGNEIAHIQESPAVFHDPGA